jgi:hypothetical protein
MLFRSSIRLLNPILRLNNRAFITKPYYTFSEKKENPISDLDGKPPLTKEDVK